MSQFAYALYKIVVTFRNLVSQDTPSFLSLLGNGMSPHFYCGEYSVSIFNSNTSERTEIK